MALVCLFGNTAYLGIPFVVLTNGSAVGTVGGAAVGGVIGNQIKR